MKTQEWPPASPHPAQANYGHAETTSAPNYQTTYNVPDGTEYFCPSATDTAAAKGITKHRFPAVSSLYTPR